MWQIGPLGVEKNIARWREQEKSAGSQSAVLSIIIYRGTMCTDYQAAERESKKC